MRITGHLGFFTVLGSVAAVACSVSADTPLGGRAADLRSPYLFLVRSAPADAEMDALIRGRLVADSVGCLRVDGVDRHTVVWPFGASLRVNSDEDVAILDANAKVIARVGEVVQLPGGEVPELPPGMLASEAESAARTSCPGRFWFVAASRP